jgi:hypothetical protein
MNTLLTISDCGCYAPLWFKIFGVVLFIGGLLLIRWFDRKHKIYPKEEEDKRKSQAFAEESKQWGIDMLKKVDGFNLDWQQKEEMTLKIQKASGL